MKTRLEHDLLGEREVPADVYYGIHTLRALENFPISKIRISTYPNFVKALAEIILVKGLLTKEQLDDILRPEVLTQPRWFKK